MSIDFEGINAERSDYGLQLEILVSAIYHAVVREGDRVVDGGANGGLHATPMAKLVGPNGKLDAFEPNPVPFKDLQQNLKGMDWAIMHPLALADQEGELKFVAEAESALSHFASPHRDAGKDTITVKAVKLDTILSSHPVSFIKLDLEGADFLGIKGARDTLISDKPIIVFENSRQWAATCYGYDREEFFQFFDDVNYDLFDLHSRPLNRASWDMKNMAWEFIGIGRNDPRTEGIIALIHSFWYSAPTRPPLTEWKDCVLAVWNVRDYWHVRSL